MAKSKKKGFEAISENPMKSAWTGFGLGIASIFIIPFGFAGAGIAIAIMGLMAPSRTNTAPHKQARMVNVLTIIICILSFIANAMYLPAR